MEPSPDSVEELSAKQKIRAGVILIALLILACVVCAVLARPVLSLVLSAAEVAIEGPARNLLSRWVASTVTPDLPHSTPTAARTPTSSSLFNPPRATFTLPSLPLTTTATPSLTPTPSLSATPTATYTPAIILGTVVPVGTPIALTLTPASASSGVVIVGGPVKGDIELIELPATLEFDQEIIRVEFKWVWVDKACQSPSEGQGFEIRIWPERPGFGPLGVMDASEQKVIFCDGASGVRMYEVGNLRSAPGVMAVDGGPFRWDVALVQLDPYKVLDVAPSRAFYLPPSAPTSTPTPGPLRVASTGGKIDLVEPQSNQTLPDGVEKLEFRWRWSEAAACELPPQGYGFELRIWPSRPDFAPMGAMGNAAENQTQIFCDPSSGLFSYQVPNIDLTPAVKERGGGDYRWDVVLARLEPYSPTVLSEVRVFQLPGD